VLWYAFPFNKEPKHKMDYYAINYCHPYFYQDWRMFTPCSKYNYTIYAIYEVHHKKHYALPIQEVLYQHNALNGREFLNISLTNSSGFVHTNAILIGNQLYGFKKDKYYEILRHVAIQYLNKKHKSVIENLKMILEVTDIQTRQKSYLVGE